MKKFFLYSLGGILGLILSGVLILAAVLFFKPTWIVNPGNLAWLLNRTHVFETWSWKNAKISHEWRHWNERRLSGGFEQFCFKLKRPGKELGTCLDLSWDFVWRFDLEDGMSTQTLKPFSILSPETIIKLSELKEAPVKQKTTPPDIYGWWQKLWADYVPDIDIALKKIIVEKRDSEFDFDFNLSKRGAILKADALDFHLEATPPGFILKAPEKYLVPEKLKLHGPWYLRGVQLKGTITKAQLALDLTGALEVVEFIVNSSIKLPLKDTFDSFALQQEIILSTRARLNMPGIKSALARYAPDPFKELPAPFNVMDGAINVDIKSSALPRGVQIESLGRINLTSSKQVLDIDFGGNVPLNLITKKPGEAEVKVNLNQVRIQLPRFSKKAPPPQFLPDKRFQKKAYTKEKEKPAKLNLSLAAENEKALHLKTNLLDEVLRLNFNLNIDRGRKSGYVSVLPLKTTLFKRPIRVASLMITFQDPVEPLIEATIRFPLPEYKITLKLEGPVSKPRYSFSSKPPLPQNDIYAVLLFGRPMADLNPDDRTSAQKTNQLLAQGILSLSVLYFLAGSPVEYVGFDPNSKNATAQFGLGSKTSLRVGGGQEGVNSSAIRRSLGKGWYLDTSVQNTNPALGSRENKSYGVLLERVINY